VDAVAVSPKKHTEIISGSHDKTIKLWDVTKPKSVLTMTGHKEGIWCVNYHKDGGQIVSASPEGLAKLWDIKTGKSTADLKVHTKRVSFSNFTVNRFIGQPITTRVRISRPVALTASSPIGT